MRRRKRRGRFNLSEEVIEDLENLQDFEEIFRQKNYLSHKIDIVKRIFFEKDELEWIMDEDTHEWFVSSKYHRYYNLNSQKGIKAFNRLNKEEREFYYERCRKTIKLVYESRNSYSFLHFYEGLENKFVFKEKEKALQYFDKYIKSDIQKEIKTLKTYEEKVSDDLKKCYHITYFPAYVNAYLFEVNQSKEELKYNLYTKTGINRFRKLSKDDKFKFLEKIREKIDNFYCYNKEYYFNKNCETFQKKINGNLNTTHYETVRKNRLQNFINN